LTPAATWQQKLLTADHSIFKIFQLPFFFLKLKPSFFSFSKTFLAQATKFKSKKAIIIIFCCSLFFQEIISLVYDLVTFFRAIFPPKI